MNLFYKESKSKKKGKVYIYIYSFFFFLGGGGGGDSKSKKKKLGGGWGGGGFPNLNKRAMMALGRSPEYHWKQIISKSVHLLSRSR